MNSNSCKLRVFPILHLYVICKVTRSKQPRRFDLTKGPGSCSFKWNVFIQYKASDFPLSYQTVGLFALSKLLYNPVSADGERSKECEGSDHRL